MEDNWKVVYSSTNPYYANLAKAVLDDVEIECVIINQKDSNFLFGSLRLYVRNEDYERAKELVDAIAF